MVRWMAAFVIGVGLLGTLSLPVYAQAVAPVSLDKIEVNLWPEYNRLSIASTPRHAKRCRRRT